MVSTVPSDLVTDLAADFELGPAGGSTYSRFSLELVRRPPELPYTREEVMSRPAAAVPFLHRLLAREPAECLGAILLSTRNHPIGQTIPFRGTISSCRVEPRPLLVTALMTQAVGLVVSHNHPSSGDPTPSAEDRGFTRRLVEAGEIVGVQLRDFLVLGEPPAYWSLRNGGAFADPSAVRPARRRPKRKPKYRHPEDADRTWIGTGRMPFWLRKEIEGGATLADFLVDGAEVSEAAARQERRGREGMADESR